MVLTFEWHTNYIKTDTSIQYILNELNDVSKLLFNRFASGEVNEATTKLMNRKSCAIDTLYDELFKYAHSKITVLFSF